MNDPTTANTTNTKAFDTLRKQQQDLRRGRAFLHLPSLALSAAAGIALGILTYAPSMNLPIAILVGLTVSLGFF